jgi:putative YphP/YqiW family bacilliredoxin
VVTVFAGQDADATGRARAYFVGYPPSSPSMGLLKDGTLVHMIERSDIECRSPDAVAHSLARAFDRFC